MAIIFLLNESKIRKGRPTRWAPEIEDGDATQASSRIACLTERTTARHGENDV